MRAVETSLHPCSVAVHEREPKLQVRGVIQAASQFNYLEFPGPDVTPEAGIAGYAYDRTQGPACAIACGAGTAFRNYLAVVNPSDELRRRKPTEVFSREDLKKELEFRGQVRERQFNGLSEVEGRLQQLLQGEDTAESTGCATLLLHRRVQRRNFSPFPKQLKSRLAE